MSARTQIRQAGFTLVEMLIVLAILALALTVSLPYARHSTEVQKVSQSAHAVSALLRAARSSAIAQSKSVVVSFDRKLRQFSSDSLNKPVQLPETTDLQFFTAKSEVSNGTADIRFYSDGSSTGGKIVFDDRAQQATISINWLTGQISRQDAY